MSRPADMLRFLGGPVEKLEVGWTGPWPPPETLQVAYGMQTGQATVIASDPDILERALAVPSIVVTVYRRRSASMLPDDFVSDRVFRGAEYVPEEEA